MGSQVALSSHCLQIRGHSENRDSTFELTTIIGRSKKGNLQVVMHTPGQYSSILQEVLTLPVVLSTHVEVGVTHEAFQARRANESGEVRELRSLEG